jgi:hypothetical protein
MEQSVDAETLCRDHNCIEDVDLAKDELIDLRTKKNTIGV